MINSSRKTISNPLSGSRGRTLQRKRSPVWQYGVTFVGVVCCLGLLLCLWDETDSIRHPARVHVPGENSSEGTTGQTVRREFFVPGESEGTTVQTVRNEFYRRYGGKQAAQAMLERGVQAFGSVQATAHRMLQSAAQNVPFVLSFAGYSVTVGRGNFYSQSFPFVVQRVIQPLLKDRLGVDVQVRNAAIGGIPSFPYAFCFEHFLGGDPQVISWDFSMNEGRGAAVLESYLRQSQHQLVNRPMVIMLDTNKQRCQLLKQYTELGLLSDAMCVGMAKDVVTDPSMLDLPDHAKAPGFQHWQEFGAPKACPGRGSWHPKKMEHELIGWMMAMYFVEAVEEAERIVATESDWKTKYKREVSKGVVSFPKPLSRLPENNQHVTDLLFGHASSNDPSTFTMKELSCRTNFLPATDQDKILPSIVVSGLSPGITAENIMQERSDEAYHAGWVLDVSKVERDTKVKVERCGGLGYVDLKTALYGVPESGTLRLWLPVEGPSHDDHEHNESDIQASHWFDELIICEANEKRPEKACHLETDLEYTVGGVKVESPRMIAGAAEYLLRETCVHVGIPTDAKITRLRDVKSSEGDSLTAESRRRLADKRGLPDDHVGIIVDLRAKDNVSRKDGACCLSHIVWEQH